METLPLILAIETATPIGSVALFSGDQLLGCIEYRRERSHAKLVAPMIRQILKELELEKEALDAIAVSKGPGSYTGLRVGVSSAKGLCMALDKPLLSLTSMETLAYKVSDLAQQIDAWICPMIDARRMEVYCEFFNADIETTVPTKAVIIDENSFSEILTERKVIFLGSGSAKCKAVLSASPNAIVLDTYLSSASDMGAGLYKRYSRSEFEDLVTFEPFYLKDFVATKPKDPFR